MSIRTMRPDDVASVSRVVIASFVHSVAEHLSAEGVATFMDLASEASLMKRMGEANTMMVYEVDGSVGGFVEIKERRHIAMLFVHPAQQRRGVGGQLIAAALRCCTSEVVTVSSSLNAVGAYLRYGFEIAGPEDTSQGLRFRPMTKTLVSKCDEANRDSPPRFGAPP